MTKTIEIRRIRTILGVAIAMTMLAEIIYFGVWGMMLFPAGNLFAKAAWTTVCGVGMGAVIGAGVLLMVEGRRAFTAFLLSAAIMFTVGVACTVLCGQIDTTFNYFGGHSQPALFFMSGLVPAVLGGLFYGWVLYLPTGRAVFDRLTAARL